MLKRKTYHPDNEEALIQLAKSDRRQFGILYEKYFDDIFRFIFKRTAGNEALTGDLTQLCFMKAMDKLPSYEYRGYPFSAWLYRIAINEVNQYFRSNKRNLNLEIGDQQLGSLVDEMKENRFSEKDFETLIKKINTLDQEHKELIEMRFFQEMSFKEIAEILEIKEANAKMKIYRILEKLEKTWNK